MNKIVQTLLFIFFIGTSLAQTQKDSVRTWPDAIDIKLLGKVVTMIPQTTSTYNQDLTKYKGDISSYTSKISDADNKMASSYGKDNDQYDIARLGKENAQRSKAMAEKQLREAQSAQDSYDAAIARMELLNKAKKAYERGAWDKSLQDFEQLVWGSYSGTGGSEDFNNVNQLTTRAAMRAADQGLILKTKRNAYEIAFLTGAGGGQSSSLDYIENKKIAIEFLTWFLKNASKIPEQTRNKYKDWFINCWLGIFADFSQSSNLTDINEFAKSIAALAISFSQTSFYDDMIYPLTHINDANNIVKRKYETPGFGTQGNAQVSDIKNLGDMNFILAAYYQEQTGNKIQALEVWLHYLDYANFNWEHKASALFLSLATKKSEELKRELDSSALTHINQNWGIRKQEFEKIKQEKIKDEKRKEAGLDWDNEK